MSNIKRLIGNDKAVVVAADIETLEELGQLIEATCDVPGIGAYKVGFVLALGFSLGSVVRTIREYTNLPIIYDHQKGGTDIPQLGQKFAKIVAGAGVDAVILFPFGGATTEREWIKACQEEGLTVLVGGHMTQEKFLAGEGGFIADSAPLKIYSIAAKMGVRNFVVPGNKIEFVEKYRRFLEKKLGKENFSVWAPGFINQGGKITKFAEKAGRPWRAIVGSAIYKADDKSKAAKKMTQEIV